MTSLATALGSYRLDTPLIAASGTVGSVIEFADVIDFSLYGAATAKSVAPEAWEGRKPPRIAPTDHGMLNGIGIQNPGIDAWISEISGGFDAIPTGIWGSAVAHDVEGFAVVATKMSGAGVSAIEVNLSCPNLDGRPFALDPELSSAVVKSVRHATDLPIGAKLSVDAGSITDVAAAVVEAGADWVVVANTAMGAAIDTETRRPLLSGTVGGYSGGAIRPITMRNVLQVCEAVPEIPIVASGGVSEAAHVVEYLLAGASAIALGTAHFATPRAAKRITRDLHRYLQRHGIDGIADLIGAYEPW